jgi:two-component sensor histidine kinase
MLLSKDATIREIHHRVKNNLQTIASLLRLQARRLQSPEGVAALQESVRRIASIALVHETLAQDTGTSEDEVAFVDVVRPLVRMVEEGLVSPDRPARFTVRGDAGRLPAQLAMPVAVVITELLQNAVDHAFPDGNGTVTVTLARSDETVHVEVADDGIGVPAGFDAGADDGLGMTIVRTFICSDLGGTIRSEPAGGPPGRPGTVVRLEVPIGRVDADDDRG